MIILSVKTLTQHMALWPFKSIFT